MFGLVHTVWGYLLYGRRPSDFSNIIRILGSWWHLKLDSIKQRVTCLQEHWVQYVIFFQRPAVWLGYMLVRLWTRCISSVDWEGLTCRFRTSQCYMVRRLFAENIGTIDSWLPSAIPPGARKIMSLVWAVPCCWDKIVHRMLVIQSTNTFDINDSLSYNVTKKRISLEVIKFKYYDAHGTVFYLQV